MSRVRIVLNYAGHVYVGGMAVKQLKTWKNGRGLEIPKLPAWQTAIKIEQYLRKNEILNASLLVYREPRRISVANSRYKQALRTLGVVRPTLAPARQQLFRRPEPVTKKQRSRIVTLLEHELIRKAQTDAR
jgi:hypothetical protein